MHERAWHVQKTAWGSEGWNIGPEGEVERAYSMGIRRFPSGHAFLTLSHALGRRSILGIISVGGRPRQLSDSKIAPCFLPPGICALPRRIGLACVASRVLQRGWGVTSKARSSMRLHTCVLLDHSLWGQQLPHCEDTQQPCAAGSCGAKRASCQLPALAHSPCEGATLEVGPAASVRPQLTEPQLTS